MPERRLAGRVAVVTGAGRGLGRSHALELARLGASVVVNDADAVPAESVAAEITATGGTAVADRMPIGEWAAADAIVGRAIDTFGRLDVLVNNAGILRPRTLVSMTPGEWGDVLRVHLDGTATLVHAAAGHWRARAKAGETLHARVVNTTSSSGLFGEGQANYAAAKAGIVAVTLVAARELAPYGVTVNAVSPVALTRMSVGMADETHSPEHAARLVGWLCTDAAAEITGEVFMVAGGHLSVVARPHTAAGADKGGDVMWSLDELDRVVPGLVAGSPPHPDLLGYRRGHERPASLSTVGLPGAVPPER